MTSLAAVMSKPDSRGTPWPGPPRPITIRRRARSFMSSARFQRTRRALESGLAEVQPVVDRGGQEVVGGGDGVEVAGELEVDLIRRGQAAGPAAGRPPLAAEDRPHRGLPEGEDAPLAELSKTLGQADRGGRLPLAGGRRRDRGDEDQLARPGGASRSRAARRILALSRP